MKTINITEQYEGERLDKAIALVFPETSLRHRRRLFTSWEIRVDGVVRGPAYKVRTGQMLTVVEKNADDTSRVLHEARIHAVAPPWAALYKPAGLDSETLAGGSRAGLDQLVEKLEPEGEGGPEPDTGWRLVSRLDREVSGLVTAAQGAAAEAQFRRMEAAGKVGKTYLLLTKSTEARLAQSGDEYITKNALDMADRKKVRVLESEDSDPARWTRFTVLGSLQMDGEEVALIQANIARGARHQIRAHTAKAGLPIVGDALYGAGDHPTGTLFLHCTALRIENFTTEILPPWEQIFGQEFEQLRLLFEGGNSPEK